MRPNVEGPRAINPPQRRSARLKKMDSHYAYFGGGAATAARAQHEQLPTFARRANPERGAEWEGKVAPTKRADANCSDMGTAINHARDRCSRQPRARIPTTRRYLRLEGACKGGGNSRAVVWRIAGEVLWADRT